jgi:hypothetical protein
MPTPDSIERGSTPDRTVDRVDGAGVYLTNEVFLYRVVASGTDGMVELEDCYCLDVVHVPVSHLGGRSLRVVTPTPA